jgi:hypothetical protein
MCTVTHTDPRPEMSLLDTARQPLTRRQLVGRVLGVGLSLPVFGGLLAACSAAALTRNGS